MYSCVCIEAVCGRKVHVYDFVMIVIVLVFVH